MEVLFYTEPAFYPYLGGVSNVALYLVNALKKDVSVTYFPRASPSYQYLSKMSKVQMKLALGRFDIIHYNIVPRFANPSSFLLKPYELKHYPTVLNIHGIIPIEHKINKKKEDFTSRFALTSTIDACAHADLIVANSNNMKELIQHYYDVSKDKIAVIPNGIQLKRFSECQPTGHLEGNPSILFIGGYQKIKGTDLIVKAVAFLHEKLPNIKLHIFGAVKPEAMQEIHAFIKAKGIEDHIIYHGIANHSMIPFYLKAVDLCVLPSRHEGFGIALLEAMASQKPAVTSDIASFREIGSNAKDVIMFKRDDPFDLSRAILRLWEDPALRERIVRNAYATASKYDWKIIAKKYIVEYEKLLGIKRSLIIPVDSRKTDIPLVSIGLPVYNGEKYLRQALDSILGQTFKDWELLICDNASNDNTAKICLEYLSRDKRIRYYRNNINVGASKNHNLVFKLSSGKYFKWASYDDILAPDLLDKCVNVLEFDNTFALCHPKTGKINESGQLTGDYEYESKTNSSKTNVRFAEIISTRNHAWVQLLGLIRSDSLRKTSLMGDYINADRNLLAELALIGPFEQIPEMLFYRREHEEAYTNMKSLNYKEKTSWWTSHQRMLLLPNWNIFRQYCLAVKRADLSSSDKLRCNVELMKWLFREGWILIIWDMALGLIEKLSARTFLAPFGRKLSWILRIK